MRTGLPLRGAHQGSSSTPFPAVQVPVALITTSSDFRGLLPQPFKPARLISTQPASCSAPLCRITTFGEVLWMPMTRCIRSFRRLRGESGGRCDTCRAALPTVAVDLFGIDHHHVCSGFRTIGRSFRSEGALRLTTAPLKHAPVMTQSEQPQRSWPMPEGLNDDANCGPKRHLNILQLAGLPTVAEAAAGFVVRVHGNHQQASWILCRLRGLFHITAICRMFLQDDRSAPGTVPVHQMRQSTACTNSGRCGTRRQQRWPMRQEIPRIIVDTLCPACFVSATRRIGIDAGFQVIRG